jgi:hypothetical protein
MPQAGPSAWLAAELGPADWMVPLGAEAAADLGAALAGMEGRRPQRASEVPMPRLAPVFADLSARLGLGRGFALLRGIPLDRAGPEGAEAVLLAIGLHLGAPIHAAEAAGPVTRLVSTEGSAEAPPRFHADPCDVLAFLCLRQPVGAGAMTLISAAAVHNALLRGGRAALEELYRPMPHLEAGAVVERPVFAMAGGVFTGRYDRDAIDATQALAEGPRLSVAQRAALTALDAAAADPALALRVEARSGDLLCLDPHLVWKRRSLAEALDAAETSREFLRLRLRAAHSRAAPAHC